MASWKENSDSIAWVLSADMMCMEDMAARTDCRARWRRKWAASADKERPEQDRPAAPLRHDRLNSIVVCSAMEAK